MFPPEAFRDKNLDGLAQKFLAAIAELFFCLEIHQDNPALLVDNDDAIWSGIDESTEDNAVLTVVQVFSDHDDFFTGRTRHPGKIRRGVSTERIRELYGKAGEEVRQLSASVQMLRLEPGANSLFFSNPQCIKRWRAFGVRRKIAAMHGATSSRETGTTKGWMRVLGVDPAAAGPTGYGIVESDGRRCRMLHYGALKITAKKHKEGAGAALDRKSTRLNSSHPSISYAVFCLKKKIENTLSSWLRASCVTAAKGVCSWYASQRAQSRGLRSSGCIGTILDYALVDHAVGVTHPT